MSEALEILKSCDAFLEEMCIRDSTKAVAGCYKVQIAYYESLEMCIRDRPCAWCGRPWAL